MVSTQNDREERIWKLLMEKRPYREICKREHCSSNEVSRVNKRRLGEINKSDMQIKNKSICSQVFDLLEKHVPLAQIIIKVDIEPDKAIKIEDEYLHVTKRDRIIYLLKDEKDLDSTIEILEFLKANRHLLKKIKEIKDRQIMIWNLMADKEEIKNEIENDQIILQAYDELIEKKQKQLGFLSNE